MSNNAYTQSSSSFDIVDADLDQAFDTLMAGVYAEAAANVAAEKAAKAAAIEADMADLRAFFAPRT